MAMYFTGCKDFGKMGDTTMNIHKGRVAGNRRKSCEDYQVFEKTAQIDDCKDDMDAFDY